MQPLCFAPRVKAPAPAPDERGSGADVRPGAIRSVSESGIRAARLRNGGQGARERKRSEAVRPGRQAVGRAACSLFL